LNAYGVEEIDVNEMEKVDGGFWGWIGHIAEFCTHGIHYHYDPILEA
jgi:hypothetical protein